MTRGVNEENSKSKSPKERYKTGVEQTLTTKVLEVGLGAMEE